MKNSFLVFNIFLIILFSFQQSSYGQTPELKNDNCSDCKRTAILSDFKNINAPDYEKQLEEWNKCIQKELGEYESFDPNDPKIKAALNKCANLLPTQTEYIFPITIHSLLAELLTNPCFHLLYMGKIKEPGAYSKWRPPEYYFTGSYETNMKGKIKSRLSISLYFEDGELIHNWKTESERPTVTPGWHLHEMFKNDDAELRKSVPLNLTLLNDFEKQPSQCDIHPEKEELFPGQETKVKISNIADIEGRKSREFNRIVVQAVDGEIEGGTPLASDPELKAFQVGKGDITFTYVAPDIENSQATEDKIVIYNSCDILKKDEYPMPKTGLKDKIAEKKISLIRADAEATITATYKVHSETHEKGESSTDDEEASSEIQVTIKASFEYDNTYSDENEGEYEEQYNLTSWKIIAFNGNLKAHSRHFHWNDGCEPTRCTFERLQDSKASAVDFRKEDDNCEGMWILFNSKTGKAKEVNTCAFPVDYTWAGQTKEKQTYVEPSGTRVINDQVDINQQTFFYFDSVGPFPEMTEVKSGDGVNEIKGSGTLSTTPGYDQLSVKWEVKRHRK
ncbi:MAG: hypothetical protein OQJ93_06815 [Ignavibacteriaceae bacterium]|nr:hypothetical protein [Ignavibacteriaceae bacterium]